MSDETGRCVFGGPRVLALAAGRLLERAAEVDHMSYDRPRQPTHTRCRGRVRVRAPGVPGLLLVLVAALFIPRQALAQKMYWIDVTLDKIQKADLDGNNVEDFITTGLQGARYLAIDSAGGKIYWTDAGLNKIMRANLDGTVPEDLVTGLDNPRGIALDVPGGKMYWVDKGTFKIQRANLDGSGSVDDLVATGGTSSPRGIAVDSAGGKMYWTDHNFDKIQQADLNGDNVVDVLTSGVVNSQDIALDVSGGKMYWTTKGGGDTVRRADLNGDNPETLVSGLGNPFGLALDVAGGKMYWCAQSGLKIQRANLDGTGSVDDLVSTGAGTEPVGIALDLSVAGGESHHWAFDETSGTTAVDSIGSSDGTLVNFPVDDSQWSCLNGGSLIFDGSDDYVSLATESDYDFTSAVTVAA